MIGRPRGPGGYGKLVGARFESVKCQSRNKIHVVQTATSNAVNIVGSARVEVFSRSCSTHDMGTKPMYWHACSLMSLIMNIASGAAIL